LIGTLKGGNGFERIDTFWQSMDYSPERKPLCRLTRFIERRWTSRNAFLASISKPREHEAVSGDGRRPSCKSDMRACFVAVPREHIASTKARVRHFSFGASVSYLPCRCIGSSWTNANKKCPSLVFGIVGPDCLLGLCRDVKRLRENRQNVCVGTRSRDPEVVVRACARCRLTLLNQHCCWTHHDDSLEHRSI